MSYYALKSLLAVFLLVAGVTALISMLTLMGRSERRLSAQALMRTHRAAGYVFVALLAVLAVLGARYLASAGDGLPLRGVVHWTLATLLIVTLALKIAIVRWYRQFMKFVPVFGLIVFSLAFVVAAVSLGFFALTGAASTASVGERQAERVGAAGDSERGEAIFARNCEICHSADSREARMGPGLAGLFARDGLPSSRRPVTRDNVREQIVAPAGSMPSFEGRLSQDELDDLLAYLETL
jgi:cytochrome c